VGGGIGLVLSIAKDALAAQQYGIFVSGHNIANVNTEGYSKQNVVQEARRPAPFGGVLLGRGVDTTQVTRSCDQIIENRVFAETSTLHSFQSMENYMIALESMFNENSDASLSNLIGDFWNRWHDVANNPSGAAERIALYEHGKLLASGLNDLDADLFQMDTDLTNAIEAGLERVNEITAEIGKLNTEIVEMETNGSANDLKDQRNLLCSELAEHIDMKIFEQSNGSFTITSAKGIVLVSGNEGYDLELNASGAVEWIGSGGNEVDITDEITKGKLGGFLEMRDEVVAEYKQNLTELTSEFVWALNQQHTQGVGLKLLQAGESVTGTYATSTTLEDLDYGDADDGYVDYSGTFNLWIGDSNGENLDSVTIDLDSGHGVIAEDSTLEELRDSINAQITADADFAGGEVTASVSGNALVLTADADSTFGFSNDSSNILAALGINTFFTGSTAGGIDVNNTIASDKDYIAAAQMDSTTSDFSTGDNTNAQAIADLQYESRAIAEHSYNRDPDIGNDEGEFNGTIEEYYHSLVGALGIRASSVERSASFAQNMLHELRTVREGISSVSLDEEMTQLMQFQHAYAAAAKLLSTSDEMLQTLLASK